jgi:hypothetical protein
MSQESETSAGDINSIYNDTLNKLSQEIIEGVKEGFKEGLKAGIKSGIQEIIGLGFLGGKSEKSLSDEDILRDAAGEGLKNMASTITKRNVCPIIKIWLERQCNEVVGMLEAKRLIKTAQDTSNLAGYLKLEETADKKYNEMSDLAKAALPSSFIADALFKGVQETLWSCTKEDIKSCQKRIIETKIAQENA